MAGLATGWVGGVRGQLALGRCAAARGPEHARDLRDALALIASEGFAAMFRSVEPRPLHFALRGATPLVA